MTTRLSPECVDTCIICKKNKIDEESTICDSCYRATCYPEMSDNEYALIIEELAIENLVIENLDCEVI